MRPSRRRARALGDAILRPLLLPAGVVLVGVALGSGLPMDDLVGESAYTYLTGLLLAIGLYGSVNGISRPQARADLGRIVVAISFGVLLKAVLVGAVLALAFRGEHEYLVLAVAMAQIDPLSVSAVLDRRDMSERAKALLAAWASFDDPVTTILVAYATALLLDDGASVGAGTAAYGETLLLNAALLLAAALIWRALRSASSPIPADDAAHAGTTANRLRVGALLALIAVAAWQFLMFGLALAALFFRPYLARWIPRATTGAMLTATLLLGMLLSQGAHLAVGLVLGAATFAAQIVVATLVTRGMGTHDRIALSLSQQNGITAIILALVLQPMVPEAVGVIAPAIFTVNALHATTNALLPLLRPRRTRTAGEDTPQPRVPVPAHHG
ncbi:hypothetical protein [Streptomyces sp. NBC_01803]|uniref:hypothetical protein n=1 Tax=Streptomyces sp. NBC_01803 TaxID=2975946 RepID=UPI002DDB4CB1|nr:hypothetical protein [Streptomyces sp. NBC_01803]WSA44238.1 cation:proton antiporter [Streptomyces sp. NBC_01803]